MIDGVGGATLMLVRVTTRKFAVTVQAEVNVPLAVLPEIVSPQVLVKLFRKLPEAGVAVQLTALPVGQVPAQDDPEIVPDPPPVVAVVNVYVVTKVNVAVTVQLVAGMVPE